jgi:glycosyltransferase involved in cell wall biosynthesis
MVSAVSVVVPCYNQAQFLTDALNSVLSQTYTNWECIIINDGSPDNTEEVALKYCSKDERFKYIYKENEDVSSARNVGIKEATGKYILPLDADDIISSNYIEEAVKVLENDDSVKLVYCKADFFGSKTGPWILDDYSLEVLLKHNMIFISTLFRKSDWFNAGGFDTNINGAEDWEFWISMLKNGGNVVCLPFVGFYYRQKEISKYKSWVGKDREKHVSYVYKKHADLILELFGNPIFLSAQNKALKNENKVLRDFSNRVNKNIFFRVYKRIETSYNTIKERLR